MLHINNANSTCDDDDADTDVPTEVDSGDEDSDQPGSTRPRTNRATSERSRGEPEETSEDRLRRWSSCVRCGTGTPDSQSHFLDCPAGAVSRAKAWTEAAREAVRAARLSAPRPRQRRLAVALARLVARGSSAVASSGDADPGERRDWHYTERAGLVPAKDVAAELDRIFQRTAANSNKELAAEKKRLIKMTRHAFVRASAHVYGDHMMDAAGRCENLAGRPLLFTDGDASSLRD